MTETRKNGTRTSGKGIILAGGFGTRLHPMTLPISKQLLPVYDKPMIYYPLSVLMEAGIRDILLISTPAHLPLFRQLLGDGAAWGIRMTYREQDYPRGLAEAYLLGADFIDNSPVVLILGDNIFHGPDLGARIQRALSRGQGATIFAYQVRNPSRYGVVAFDRDGQVVQIVEKPKEPPSNWAITGLYVTDSSVVDKARNVRPSWRGELEITDVHEQYRKEGRLHVERLGRGYAWLDAGTPESLLDAANYVRTIEQRQGQKIACPEIVAFESGFINLEQLRNLAEQSRETEYAKFILRYISEAEKDI